MAWATPVIHAVGDVLTASDWNINSNDLIYLYGDLAWTSVGVFTNSWANAGGGNPVAQYKRLASVVIVTGVVTGGASGTVVFTLPAGYRPALQQVYPIETTGGFGVLVIATSGTVSLFITSGANPSRLDTPPFSLI